MPHEVVRPATLSRSLTVQLLLGNAIEVVLLSQIGVVMSDDEAGALRHTATQLRTGTDVYTASSSVMSADAVDIVTTARQAFSSDTLNALSTRLGRIAAALERIADTRSLNTVDVDDLVQELSAMRDAVSAKTSVPSDDVRR